MKKGILVALLAMGMTTTSVAQQSPENTPKSGPFILELTDLQIEQLKLNPEGLIAQIPEHARGHITHVVLKYKPAGTPRDTGGLESQNSGDPGYSSELGKTRQAAWPIAADANAPLGGNPASANSQRSQINSMINPGASNRRTDSNTTSFDDVPAGNSNAGSAAAQRFPSWDDKLQLPAKKPTTYDDWQFRENQGGSLEKARQSAPNQRIDQDPNSLQPQLRNSSRDAGKISQFQSLEMPVALQDELDREIERINSLRNATERTARQIELQQQKLDAEWSEIELWKRKLAAEEQTNAEYGNARFAMLDNGNRLGTYGRQLVDPNTDSYRLATARSTAAQLPLPTTGPTTGPPPVSINGPQQRGVDSGSSVNPASQSASPLANSAVQTANKASSFLLFMLLCSIGLNVYLSWIARGFYMRYAELADELRETFTSTT